MTTQPLKGYKNKITNSRRIFTAEDIDFMSPREFIKNEKAINYQLGNLGVPTNDDLDGSPLVIFIQEYIRKDGTKVRSHYRSKPGHSSILTNNGEHSNIADDGTQDNKFEKVIYETVIKDLYPEEYEKYKKEHPEEKEKETAEDKEIEKEFEGAQMCIDIVKAAVEDISDDWTGKVYLQGAVSQMQGFKDNLVKAEKAKRGSGDSEADEDYFKEMLKDTMAGLTELANDIRQNGFEDINWSYYARRCGVQQFASMINPYVGMAATIAIDIVPNIIRIIDSSKIGDKEVMFEAVYNLSEASIPMLMSIGESIGDLKDKVKETKEVQATLKNLEAVTVEAQRIEAKALNKTLEAGNYKNTGDLTGGASGVGNDFNVQQINKRILDVGINTFGGADAKGMWNASSGEFEDLNYMEKNALSLKNSGDLSPNFESIVNEKLRSQNLPINTPGFIFVEDSIPSKTIANSSTVSDFILDNREILLCGQTISKSSVEFKFMQNPNLWGAFHYADILNAKIDANGDFNAIVLDTYEYNTGSKEIVGVAKSVQDAGLLKNYFTLHIIKIPKQDLIKVFTKKWYNYNINFGQFNGQY